MSETRENRANKSPRRLPGGPAEWWRQHRSWVAGLNRKQKLRYRLFQLLVVVAVLAIALCMALRSWIRLPDIPEVPSGTDTTETGQTGFEGAELPDVANSGRKPGVYTFLLVGQDTGGGGNTDTIILFTFDTVNKTLHGMSLPRDTMINTSHTGAGHRLNAVYNYNKGRDPDTQVEKGMTALQNEVGKLTGIVPDFYVLVQWEAVGQLVEAIGGVWFEVPFDMNYDDPAQDLHIHQEAGYRLLSGEDAMEVVRWRQNNTGSSGGDVARIPIQQDFLKAAISQCLQPSTLLKAPSLVQIFMDNVDTDLSIGNILAFAQLAAGMDTENDVTFVTMPWTDARYSGGSMVLPAIDELLETLNSGFNPYQDEIQSSDLQVLYRNSDGSYGVTSGTLQDSSLARPRGSSSSSGSSSGGSSEATTEEPDETGDTSGSTGETPSDSSTTPDAGTGAGDSSDSSQNPQPGDDGAGGAEGSQSTEAEPSLPEETGGSDGESQTGTSEGTQNDPSYSQSGDAGDSSGGSAGGAENEEPPSQDITNGSGLTVSDLPIG